MTTAAAPRPPTPDLLLTFNVMTQRRLHRQFQGVYRGPTKVLGALSKFVWTYLLVLAVGTVGLGTRGAWGPRDLGFVLGLIVASAIVTTVIRTRVLLVMAYGAIAVHLLFLITTGDVNVFALMPGNTRERITRQWLAIRILVALETVIVAWYLVVYVLYPMVITRGSLNVARWFDLRPGTTPRAISYTSISLHRLWRSPRLRFECSYAGGLDKAGRPHGFGIWRDTSFHGETMTGLWEHGRPIGPFTSREHGSGYVTQQRRVAFAYYRRESSFEATAFVPAFPVERQHDKGPESAAACETLLRTTMDEIVYRDLESDALTAPTTVSSYRETLVPEIRGPGETLPEKEALVYIHGVNSSVNKTLRNCGRLLAMGDFPPHIHPFAFCWPSGNIPFPLYWLARTIADSDELAAALRVFLESIIDGGYTKIHVFAHSMGARVFLNALENGYFQGVLRAAGSSVEGNERILADLVSVTLCSPEFPLPRFVRRRGTFDALRQYCTLVTIYGDKWDQALLGSELANMSSIFGPIVPALGRRVTAVARDTSNPRAPPTSHGEFDAAMVDKRKTRIFKRLIRLLHKTSSSEDTNGLHESSLQSSYESPLQPSYGSMEDGNNHLDQGIDEKQVYLDLDVVDTSFTDNNVGNRHSYYRLNESIVSDIREIVTHKRRARARPGIMRQVGNTFIFLSPPSNIA